MRQTHPIILLEHHLISLILPSHRQDLPLQFRTSTRLMRSILLPLQILQSLSFPLLLFRLLSFKVALRLCLGIGHSTGFGLPFRL